MNVMTRRDVRVFIRRWRALGATVLVVGAVSLGVYAIAAPDARPCHTCGGWKEAWQSIIDAALKE